MPIVEYVGLPVLEARAIAALTEGVGKAAHDLEGRAKGATPVDTGTLRASIHTDGPHAGGMSVTARVQTGGEASSYAILVHEGTGPHKITAHGKALAFDGHFAKSVHHPGTPAFKFLEGPLVQMAGVYEAFIAAAARGAF